jgi:peptide/nickel transport system substrate-binding protein
MYLKRVNKITLVIIAVAFMVVQVAAAVADDRKTLTVAVQQVTKHLDPMGFNGNVNERVSSNFVETLIDYNYTTGKLEPCLATEWRMVNDVTVELKLRKNVKCHNGEDFDASDVEYMFGPARLVGKDAPGYPVGSIFFPTLKEVKAVDSHTVRFVTTTPDPVILNRLSGFVGQVPCADAFKQAKSWEQWGLSVVGTGPYKVVESKPLEVQRFEAFDGYWGKKAPLKSLTLKVVPETSARVAGLLAGDYDMITEINPDQFASIEKNPNYEIAGGPVRITRILHYDEHHPVLADPRVRLALSLAIDRKLIVDSLFAGKTAVPPGMQDPSFGDMFVKDFEPIKYNPELAKKLLKEAGYKGQHVTYRYQTGYYAMEAETAQVLQQMWKAVGFNVDLVLKENWDQIYDAADGTRAIFNWTATGYYADPLGQIYRIWGPEGPLQNKMATYVSPEMNSASQGIFSTDKATRLKATKAMMEVYERTDPPGTYLHYLPLFYGKRKNVIWKDTGTAFMDFRAGAVSFK